MRKHIIPDNLKNEYLSELSKLFYVRVNLFCYIAIFSFCVELLCAFTVFRGIISAKDTPGVIGGIFFAILLLATGKLSRLIHFQKARAFFFTMLLILIAILSATAHPHIMPYMGITLVLLAFFLSVIFMPWSFFEAIIIGVFTLINFIWVYRATGTFISNEIFGINIVLLGLAVFAGAIAERSEEILRIKLFISRKEIEQKNLIMAKELDLANKIHKTIIPHSVKNNLVDIVVTYKPMLYLGGDYAKFHFIDKDKLLFIVVDVTGHGVSSALLVNRVHAEVERLIREKPYPGELLGALDKFITEDFGKMGYYLSAFCGLINFSNKKLIYSNYGHPPQILLQSEKNNIVLMESQTFFMGIGMDVKDVYHAEISFSRGDRLILFTDGVIEAKDATGELFGHKRLEGFVKQNFDLDVTKFSSELLKEIDRFQTGQQNDDIFLLTIQTK